MNVLSLCGAVTHVFKKKMRYIVLPVILSTRAEAFKTEILS